MGKFIGIVIAFTGAVLGLTALVGFSVDKVALLSAVQAPAFEPALRVLLDSHRVVFTICSFGLVFFILICSVISFGKGTTHMGFTIMVTALLAGFAAWPHGTPFMLIVMFGAHWIVLSELSVGRSKSEGHAAAVPTTSTAGTTPRAAQSNATTATGASASAEHEPNTEEGGRTGRRGSLFNRMMRRLFH